MSDRYKTSMEWLARARAVTPGGAQTLSKQAGKFSEGAHPAFLIEASGSHVWDVDGHEYIDWICGLGAISIGYQRGVMPGIMLNLNAPSWSLPTPIEVEVAERLCAVIPCAEQVRFLKTGSESTEAAIRVARRATGRDVILCIEGQYHGWHSWHAATKPVHHGVPKQYEELVWTVKYNGCTDREWCEFYGVPGRNAGQVAAVIMEPTLFEPPRNDWLLKVRDWCLRNGVVLIFDEMVTGFRWARAGGQEYFGVVPDLACFGKGMANGFPLACLVGRRELMQYADVVSGTFGGEALSLAACQAVLDVYEKEPVIAHLWRIGGLFVDGLKVLIAKHQLPAVMEGYPVHPRLRWTAGAPQPREVRAETEVLFGLLNRQLMSLWLQEMAAGGVLVHPSGWNVSYAHTEQDVVDSLKAADLAFAECKRALATGDWFALKGKLIEDNPFRAVVP